MIYILCKKLKQQAGTNLKRQYASERRRTGFCCEEMTEVAGSGGLVGACDRRRSFLPGLGIT